MSKVKYIIIAIAVGLIWYYWRLYKASQQLSFGIGSIKGLKLKDGAIVWVQGLKATNPTQTPIPVNASSVKNFILGKEVGTTTLQGFTSIQALQTTELLFDVKLPYEDLVLALGGLTGAIKNRKFDIKFTGRVWAAGIPVGVDESFNLDLTTIL